MVHLISKPSGFSCAPQAVPTDISHFQKSALPKFRNRNDTTSFNQTQQPRDMNTNCNRLDLHKGITTKEVCAHECLATVEPQPARREAAATAGKPANHDADQREKNLHRAIVIGAGLILLLVIAVYYLRYVAPMH